MASHEKPLAIYGAMGANLLITAEASAAGTR
jgi:hypothetical protein